MLFSVRVLSQQRVKPAIVEARLLQIPARQTVLLRQVQVLCGRRVLVQARSIIPLNTLQGRHSRLKHLRDKPPGGYRCVNLTPQRRQLPLATITRNAPLFGVALAHSAQNYPCIWGRRLLFTLARKSLPVSEFFLPALFQRQA